MSDPYDQELESFVRDAAVCDQEVEQPPTKEIAPQPDDVSDELPCLLCGGPLHLMGSLGYREWLRCSGCGMDFGREIPRPPTPEIDP